MKRRDAIPHGLGGHMTPALVVLGPEPSIGRAGSGRDLGTSVRAVPFETNLQGDKRVLTLSLTLPQMGLLRPQELCSLNS